MSFFPYGGRYAHRIEQERARMSSVLIDAHKAYERLPTLALPEQTEPGTSPTHRMSSIVPDLFEDQWGARPFTLRSASPFVSTQNNIWTNTPANFLEGRDPLSRAAPWIEIESLSKNRIRPPADAPNHAQAAPKLGPSDRRLQERAVTASPFFAAQRENEVESLFSFDLASAGMTLKKTVAVKETIHSRYAQFSFDFLIINASPQVVESFLVEDPQLLLCPSPYRTQARLPIARAVEEGRTGILEVLLNTLKANIGIRDRALHAFGRDRQTAMHLAIGRDDAKILGSLLQAGADPYRRTSPPYSRMPADLAEVTDSRAETTFDALDFAISRNSVAAVRHLLLWDERPVTGAWQFRPALLERRMDNEMSPAILQELRESKERRARYRIRPSSKDF